MFVDRIYHPVTTLGPGRRIAVWTCGCSKHCPGCATPELWPTRPDASITVERLADLLRALARRTGTHRITFTGGDPLEQADELGRLLALIRPAFDDILVYTGFTREELPTLPAQIDALIDGPYVAALNDGACGLRGSTNQRLIVLNPALETLYHEEERKPRRVQNAVFDGRALSIGIHGRPAREGPS